jgi:hypothetical protein
MLLACAAALSYEQSKMYLLKNVLYIPGETGPLQVTVRKEIGENDALRTDLQLELNSN